MKMQIILFSKIDKNLLNTFALFSLKNRTKYDIQQIREFIHRNPNMKELIEMEQNREIEIAVMENLINATTEEAIEYSNCEIIVCKIKEGNILLSDRPFLHKLFEDYSFVALSPFYFISLRKTKEEPVYVYNKIINNDIIHFYNKMTAENSRNWIVSNNRTTRKICSFITWPKR